MTDGPKSWSPRGKHPVDLSWFNLENLWNEARELRDDPDLEWIRTAGGPWWIMDIASGAAGMHQADEVVNFFGIPEGDVKEYWRGGAFRPEVWDEVLLPFADEVARALNRRKPGDLPGRFSFGWSEADNAFGLEYDERPEGEA